MKTHYSKYSFIKIALFTGLISFIVFVLLTTIGCFIFFQVRHMGLLTQKNWMPILLLDFIVLYLLFGSILALFTIKFPLKRMLRLIGAMERISKGDFSVRLNNNNSTSEIVNKTVEIFNNMSHQLESTEMLSNDFINNFSHEFKTPISSINGFCHLLRDETLTKEERDEYLDIITQESERLSNLSVNILILSKLEGQSVLTDKTCFNLCEQLRITAGSLYARCSEKNLNIDFKGQDFDICANREMLGQVWINLIENAVKFSPEGEQITITAEKSGDTVTVTVTNLCKNEITASPERFFDKFYQGDISHATNGNGLGLSMAKRIVELHNGSIFAEISDKKKVILTVNLPL